MRRWGVVALVVGLTVCSAKSNADRERAICDALTTIFEKGPTLTHEQLAPLLATIHDNAKHATGTLAADTKGLEEFGTGQVAFSPVQLDALNTTCSKYGKPIPPSTTRP